MWASTTQRSNNSYFKKSAPEFVDFWGRSGRLPPPKNNGRRWAAKPPTCARCFLGDVRFNLPTSTISGADFLKQQFLDLGSEEVRVQ